MPGMATKQPPSPYDFLPEKPTFTLTSAETGEGKTLTTDQLSGIFGVPGGKDVSPSLSWSGFPKETKSFAVTCFDPDAPTGSGFWHWGVFNIPASTTSLPVDAGNPEAKKLPEGAITIKSDAGAPRFIGAAPPAGHGPHRYIFVVHALGVEKLEGVGPDASNAFLGFNLFFHTIARAFLTPIYENKG